MPAGEVPRPATTAAGEVPRPGAAPAAPTATTSAPAAAAAPRRIPTSAAELTSAERENLSARSNCTTCHFNDVFGQTIKQPIMTEDMLVKMNFVTTVPATLLVPRPPDYRDKLILKQEAFYRSAHRNLECIVCHDSITTFPHPAVLPDVKCARCHPQEDKYYTEGNHGKACAKGDTQAPSCERCHGTYHEMLPSSNTLSPIFQLNIPYTCAGCHASSSVLDSHQLLRRDSVETYFKTVHGDAIILSGLMGAAVCSDCHGSHRVLNHADPLSSVSLRNLAYTCGTCHRNDTTTFTAGLHGRSLVLTDYNTTTVTFVHSSSTSAPSCNTCHPGHNEIKTNTAAFQLSAVEVCGTCHKEYYKTYRDTYHGKVMRYGGLETARCDDCHGYHHVEPSTATLSPLSPGRIVKTCKSCHPYSNGNFVKFLAHLEPSDQSHPQIYYPWLFMSVLLIGTLGFFFVHSACWLIRELIERGRNPAHAAAAGGIRYQRFNLLHRLTHAFLFISVIGLAVTGLPLRYHTPAWAGWIFGVFGGHTAPRVLHRIFAALTLLYAGMHFVYLWNLWRRAPKRPILHVIFGPYSMLPNWTDIKQFFQHGLWFFGIAPQPKWGRWTYWEKFDYWAVFWGVAIIGASGLIMALPRVTSWFLPGWAFNLALIVHSDEALLAASFLFAIHFFHVHLRPAKFPIDHVIFTGSMTREEYESERGVELAEFQKEGRLESLRAHEPNATQLMVDRVVAAITLTIGLALLAGMFWTEIIARFL